MEADVLLASFRERLKGYGLPIGIACIGLVVIGYGLIASFSSHTSSDITFEQGTESLQQTTEASARTVSSESLYIDISGAVVKPGVYAVPADARVQDAVLKAGGFAEDADMEEIARAINLAAKVADAEKIYIPFGGETVGAVLGQAAKVSLNKATSGELDQLRGIGPVTVEKIIANRPYQTTEGLLTKKVVSTSVFEKIKDKVGL